jgi:hypothetical protein
MSERAMGVGSRKKMAVIPAKAPQVAREAALLAIRLEGGDPSSRVFVVFEEILENSQARLWMSEVFDR